MLRTWQNRVIARKAPSLDTLPFGLATCGRMTGPKIDSAETDMPVPRVYHLPALGRPQPCGALVLSVSLLLVMPSSAGRCCIFRRGMGISNVRSALGRHRQLGRRLN